VITNKDIQEERERRRLEEEEDLLQERQNQETEQLSEMYQKSDKDRRWACLGHIPDHA